MKVKSGVYKILLKTDKYGNKTYKTNCCKRCGGSGFITFSGVDGSRCWGCGATGIVEEYKTVEYTPEQAQLRREKSRAKKLGTVEQQLSALGFNKEGVGYILRGDTFAIKEQIKRDGGRYNSFRGWVMPFKPDYWDDFKEIHAVIEDCGEQFKYKFVHFDPGDYKA